MSKYFQTKDGSLEAVSTKIAKEQPTIEKQEANVKLERKTYFENKPGSLGDVAARVVSEGYIAEAKYSIDMADASYIKGSELMKAMRQAKKDGNTKKALDDLDILAGDDEQGISFTAANDNEAVRKAEKALQDYRNKSTRNDRNALFAFDRLELRMVGDKLATNQQKNMFKRVFDKYDNKAMFNTSNNRGPSDLQQFVNKTKLDDMVVQGQMFEGFIKEEKFKADYTIEKNAPSHISDEEDESESYGSITVSAKDAGEAKKKIEDEIDKRVDKMKKNPNLKGYSFEGYIDGSVQQVSEALDPVNKDAVKKKFADRKDKDIDNDGDVDSSDKFLHKRRKAISKSMKEDLGKEDEKSVKDVIKGLKKAVGLHGKQAASLDKALKNEDNVGVRPDDKGEVINKKKHDAYGGSKGETKPVDPEPKISQVIKGEKETTRANGHMTKKRFSEMRVKLGKNGKTETGQDAATVETEPKAERI